MMHSRFPTIAANPLAAVALAALLSGCGRDEEPAPPPTVPEPVATDTAAAAPGDEALANAVVTSKTAAAVDLKYDVLAKPAVGQAFEIELTFLPRLAADLLEIEVTGIPGLEAGLRGHGADRGRQCRRSTLDAGAGACGCGRALLRRRRGEDDHAGPVGRPDLLGTGSGGRGCGRREDGPRDGCHRTGDRVDAGVGKHDEAGRRPVGRAALTGLARLLIGAAVALPQQRAGATAVPVYSAPLFRGLPCDLQPHHATA